MLHFFKLLIFGCTVSFLLGRLSLVAASRGYPPVPARALLIAAASLVSEHGLLARGLSGCGARAFAVLWHVRSSRSGDRTRVSCIGRWILNHWTTGSPYILFIINQYLVNKIFF